MAGNVFKSMRDKIENSPWAILVFALFAFGIFLSASFLYEDFMANWIAYQDIPTRKSSEDIIALMAIGFQVAPVFFFVIFLFDEKNQTKFFLSVAFLFIDWGIGIYYRNPNQGIKWLAYTALEDLIFFTLGSEILLTLSVGMCATLFFPMLRGLMKIVEYFGSGGKVDRFVDSMRSEVQGKPDMPPPGYMMRCPIPNCGAMVKRENMQDHIQKAHRNKKGANGGKPAKVDLPPFLARQGEIEEEPHYHPLSKR